MQLSGPEILRQMELNNPHNPGEYGRPNIIIEPFDERCLGSNSYDLHLSPMFKVYKDTIPFGMKPFVPYDKNHEYSMQDWFYSTQETDELAKTKFPKWKNFSYNRAAINEQFPNVQHPHFLYVAGNEEYDLRNPKFLIDTAKNKETFDFEIPEEGAILNPQLGYLASTVEYTETYNLFPYIDGKSSLGRNFVLNHHTAGRGDDGFCGYWTLEIRVLHPTVVYPYMRIGQIYYEQFVGERKPYNTIPSSHYHDQSGPTAAASIPVDLFIKDLVQHKK